MSKSYVNVAPEGLRSLLRSALEKLNAFAVRHEAEVKAELVRRGRATVRGWLAAKVGRPLTDDKALGIARGSQLWWLGLPEDHGYISDRRLFQKLLAACEASEAIMVQLYVEELRTINWWLAFGEK